MTEVKICGITNLEDAFVACDSGADALGFIFYKESPRYVAAEEVREIIRKLPRDVAKVGVFVDLERDIVWKTFEYCRLDFIQLHGDESAEYSRAFPPSILIKAIAARQEKDLKGLDSYRVKAFLIDSRGGTQYGDTGELSNWKLAAEIQKKHAVILAGGLTPDNVEAGIQTVSPEAVDVSSGVEAQPGKKDQGKIKRFIDRVRAAGWKEGKGIFKSEKWPEKEKGLGARQEK